MTGSYKIIGIFEFGQGLLDTGDLDPVYIMLWEAKLEHKQLCQWLVAYWCFYHCGVASQLSESRNFFADLAAAVPGTDYPRGSERRHFRGEQAVRAVAGLRSLRQTCEQLVEGVFSPELSVVLSRVRRWDGFGPWIAFKVADMLERLDLCSVEFLPDAVFSMFKSPREGAELMAATYGHRGDPYVWAHDTLMKELGDLLSPPRYERKINIQEVETILCKWHSHCNGHYPIGKDCHEVREGLAKYNCKTASKLIEGGRIGGIWL